MILGFMVVGTSLRAISVRFSASHKSTEQKLLDEAIAQRQAVRTEPRGAMPA